MSDRPADLSPAADSESQPLALAAWIYHLGLAGFSFQEHPQRAVKSILVATIARAAVTAGAALSRKQPLGLSPVAAGFVLDVPTVCLLARHLDPSASFDDRALSQLGLATSVSAMLDPATKATPVTLAGFPLLIQSIMAWKLGYRGWAGAVYIIREATWSWTCLEASQALRDVVVQALRTQREDTAVAAANERQSAKTVARSDSFIITHNTRLNSLTTLYLKKSGSRNERLAELIRSDGERWRRFGGAPATVQDLVGRLCLHRELRGLETRVRLEVDEARLAVRRVAAESFDRTCDGVLINYPDPLFVRVDDAPYSGEVRGKELVIETAEGIAESWGFDV